MRSFLAWLTFAPELMFFNAGIFFTIGAQRTDTLSTGLCLVAAFGFVLIGIYRHQRYLNHVVNSLVEGQWVVVRKPSDN